MKEFIKIPNGTKAIIVKADKKYSEIYSKDFYVGRDNIELIEEA